MFDQEDAKLGKKINGSATKVIGRAAGSMVAVQQCFLRACLILYRLSGLREAQRILERMEAKNKIAKEVVRLSSSTNGF